MGAHQAALKKIAVFCCTATVVRALKRTKRSVLKIIQERLQTMGGARGFLVA
jgi:hypothetical protein